MTQLPELKTEHLAVKRAYRNLFKNPDARAVLDDLDYRFNRSTLKKVNGVIDPHASIAAGGAREVLLYIELMMRDKDATTN
jgi:hypothetical protein